MFICDRLQLFIKSTSLCVDMLIVVALQPWWYCSFTAGMKHNSQNTSVILIYGAYYNLDTGSFAALWRVHLRVGPTEIISNYTKPMQNGKLQCGSKIVSEYSSIDLQYMFSCHWHSWCNCLYELYQAHRMALKSLLIPK